MRKVLASNDNLIPAGKTDRNFWIAVFCLQGIPAGIFFYHEAALRSANLAQESKINHNALIGGKEK
jgi:hypothetical protein